MNDFESFKLPEFLSASLKHMQITTPTPIQVKSIPPALLGQDILASAQTGSGKTIAYLLPLIINLLAKPNSRGLILLPTRELAQQVGNAMYQLLTRSKEKLHTAVLIGGEPIRKQFFQLNKNPQIIIGTPGRVCDHLNRHTLSCDKVNFFVLDEVDRMLDMGFSDELEMISKQLPKARQTFMFSATLPANIEKLAHTYLNNPQRITVGDSTKTALEIKQEIFHTSIAEKFPNLLKQLSQRDGSIIIFVKTKQGAENLAEKLKRENHSVQAIHGDLHQRNRERVILSFRNQKSRIMVATDIAARGLDVPHVQHVINYDLPSCPEDYVHRIGRTGRAGAKGHALSLITPEEARKWRLIDRFINGKAAASSSDYGRTAAPSGFNKSRGRKPAPTSRARFEMKPALNEKGVRQQRSSSTRQSINLASPKVTVKKFPVKVMSKYQVEGRKIVRRDAQSL